MPAPQPRSRVAAPQAGAGAGDVDWRESLSRGLSRANFVVFLVSSGMLDLRMPKLSGEATFDALRLLAPSLRVLIWSGHGAEQDVDQMLRRGAVGFVQKPYRVTELSRVVADVIRKQPASPLVARAMA